MAGTRRYRPGQLYDLSREFAVFRIGFGRSFLIATVLGSGLGSGLAGPVLAQVTGGGADDAGQAATLVEGLLAEEAEARAAARAAWDASEAADAARDAAAAELERREAEARAARQAAQEAIAVLSEAIGQRQAAEARIEDAAEAAASEELEAEARQQAARLAEEEAARIAAEEAAARQATEAEAARRTMAEAALERCIAVAGAPSAEEPISEEAQRALFRALAEARGDCVEAARDLPEAGGALFHLGTIAQATGEHRQAVRFYERAAEAGVGAALTRLGDYHNFGIRPVREDVARAVEFYEEAVAAGDPAAAATLAMMHRLGRGVPRDPDRMMALMQQGAEAGYHFAQYRLAQTYLTGEGVPDDAQAALGLPDPVSAIPHLAGAARSGNDEAARDLARLYATGAPGLNPNPARRFRWTEFLADKGDAPAMALRAFFIEQGIGTERDPERAAAEYVRALETGGVDPESMRGTVNGVVPPWDTETALAFQRILQERGLYLGALDAQVGPGTLGAARALSQQ